MDRLHRMKEALMNCVEGQVVGHLDQADAKELGEAIDMIKDLSEAIYYCTITEAMNKEGKEEKSHNREEMYYPARYYPYPMYYDDPSRMYYDGNSRSYYGNGGRGSTSNYSSGNRGSEGGRGNGNEGSDGNSQTAYYHDPMKEQMMRDYREGRSGLRRRMYMEGKQNHHDKTK